jgi:hypothetical protein
MQGPLDQGWYSSAAQPTSQNIAKLILPALDVESIKILQTLAKSSSRTFSKVPKPVAT